MVNQFEEYRLKQHNQINAQKQAEAEARQKRRVKASTLAEDAANFAQQSSKNVEVYPKEEGVTLAKGQLLLSITVTNTGYEMKLSSEHRPALMNKPAGLITGFSGNAEDMQRVVTEFILED